MSGVAQTPGGVTGYTSLAGLEGITSVADNGAGRNHLDYLANRYPNSVIALGLYIVDYLPAITSGAANGNIDFLLDKLRSYNRPVFLRFGYEYDGGWNHYDPAQYKAAWIYFYNRMVSRSVTNIAMVWQGASYCGGTYLNQPISAWYPGDQYVDWMGLSYFTPQDCNWAKVNEAAEFARSHNKPVLIAESSPQRYDIAQLTYTAQVNGTGKVSKTAAQIWSEWFATYFNFINLTYGDVIRGVAYINANWDIQPMWDPPYDQGYWGDSRVQADATILNNWKAATNQSSWLKASSNLFSLLGYGGSNPTSTPGSNPTATRTPTRTNTPGSNPTATNTSAPSNTPSSGAINIPDIITITQNIGTNKATLSLSL